MKKILSSLLAFAMVLALFSGIVVFNSSAIDPNALVTYEYYDLAGFTQTTQAELDTLSGNVGYADGAIYNAVTSRLELTEKAGEVKEKVVEKGKELVGKVTGDKPAEAPAAK